MNHPNTIRTLGFSLALALAYPIWSLVGVLMINYIVG